MILCSECGNNISNSFEACCQNIKGQLESDYIKFIKETHNNKKDYQPERLHQLHKFEDEFVWFRIRKKWIHRIFKKYISVEDSILEIGAGTGNVALYLREKGYKNYAVNEIFDEGIKYIIRKGIKPVYQFDARYIPFKNHFSAIALFDVIEHLNDDTQVINEVNKALINNGKIVITVPAHSFLWSHHDDEAGHKRRYSRNELITVLQKSGFRVEMLRYIFSFLFPFYGIRSVMTYIKTQNTTSKDFEISTTLNKVMIKLGMLDYKLNQMINLPFGGSLIAVASKDDSI